MEDPSSIVPHNDPSDNLFYDEIMHLLESPNSALEDLITQEVPFVNPSSLADPCCGQIDDLMDPLKNPVIRDLCTESNQDNSLTTSFGVFGGISDQIETKLETCTESNADNSLTTSFGVFGGMSDQIETKLETESSSYENSRPLSVWPSEPVPFGCSYCQVLREIIHTNGTVVTKLELHGRLGMICHAIVDQPGGSNPPTPGHQYLMFDFCKKSIEDVKQFLRQYCTDRSQTGYVMIKDPLSVFYEALCVGVLGSENLSSNGDFVQPSSANAGAFQRDQAGTRNKEEKTPKPSLAAQRERVKHVTLEEIENHYHLPIDEAAKRMEFCPTVLKRLCRKYGVHRWPHRKIQSMEKKISHWTSRLNSNDPQEKARAQNEIQNLQRQMAKFGEGGR